jgi:hypothetical protein
MHNVIALLFFTLLAINITQAAQETKNLGEVNLVQNDESALIKTIRIDMDFSVLNTKEATEIIFPFPDKTLVIWATPVAGKRLGLPQGQFAWIGYSKYTDDVFILRIAKAFEATVQFAGKVYHAPVVI